MELLYKQSYGNQRLYSRINISFFFKLIPGARPFTKGNGTSFKVEQI